MSRRHEPIEINGWGHEFHADATVLSGSLRVPLKNVIEPQAQAHLYHDGGYLSEHSGYFRLEGVLSFERAYTQVAGHKGAKEGHGWSTLSTTVVEGLNVLEVLTADRVVGQIITEHPEDGYVPRISFLGTRFENLRIVGRPVELELDLNILGERHKEDHAYSKHPGVLERVKDLVQGIGKPEELPTEVSGQYNRLSSNVGSAEAVECSLVKKVKVPSPAISFGHIIQIPDFGTIELAKLTIHHEQFGAPGRKHNTNPNVPDLTTVTLTMIDLKLGCAIDGDVPIGVGSSNGVTKPPGGG